MEFTLEHKVEQAMEVGFGLPGQSNPEAHLGVFGSRARSVELALQRCHHDIGVNVLAGAARLVTRAQATGNELW